MLIPKLRWPDVSPSTMNVQCPLSGRLCLNPLLASQANPAVIDEIALQDQCFGTGFRMKSVSPAGIFLAPQRLEDGVFPRSHHTPD